MSRLKPIGGLSLDLDNKWSYLKTHGDPGWESFPSYLKLLVPGVLEFLKQRDLLITFFVVGQDAALDENVDALKAIVRAGHEIGNHSYSHEPWFHLYSPSQIEEEIARAEDVIENISGRRPVGFRGPGFSLSAETLRVLRLRGYHYDASTLPSWIGPLARAYYMATGSLSGTEAQRRGMLFGSFADCKRPLNPYFWPADQQPVVELPVTTMPVFRTPFHASYVLYLATYSEAFALAYFRAGLWLCRQRGIQPSILLHPLDFLGGDEVSDLDFFPAMKLPGEVKRRIMAGIVDDYRSQFEVVPLGVHAKRVVNSPNVPIRTF
jgi:hypothetical protein